MEEYAVGGAMAMVFWAEPTLTFDLDVFVLLPPADTALDSRAPVEPAEHVMIHGTPVQFLVSPNALADEAIAAAAVQELDGVPCRVMRPEHLCALWLQAGGSRRRERVQTLREAGVVDEAVLADLLRRHGVRG